MYQNSFEMDVMDDLSFDAAEGPAVAQNAYDEYDDYGDEFDDYDAAEDDDDAFLSGLARGVGQAAGSVLGGDEFDDYDDAYDAYDDFEAYDAYDEFDEYDAYDAYDEYDDYSAMDSFEDAMADALDAEDTDEFLRRIRRAARAVGNVARRVAPVVGRVARAVAPIASAIPLPQAQAIGRIASVAGRLLADGADEFEVLDAMIDMAEEEDAIDAAAPMIAGMALRTAAPRVARAALPVRRQAVRAVSQSVQTLARQQGAPAARAAVRVTRAVGRRPVPARAVGPAVRRITPQVARRPGVVRRLSRPLAPGARPGGATGRRRRMGAPRPRPGMTARRPLRRQGGIRPGVMRPGARPGVVGGIGRVAGCPTCGRARQFNLRGPVTLTVRSHG
ncbi:hypothetical protein [Nodosilinea sp. FACHB-13]|uniref:hypothetical protein n=1 Tax=Cyanophyceae TaxID=3028117 RepID=UPI00168741B3|nr:hypothetical protein [Nodosilinea sp. FACHB-13]MBD2108955.1 hypothetical protein [Nodosilinea sp. FACHB-13]